MTDELSVIITLVAGQEEGPTRAASANIEHVVSVRSTLDLEDEQ